LVSSQQGTFRDFPFSGRNNKLWVPVQASASIPLPLIVALHGCTQSPTDFSIGTGLNLLGDRYGYFVLYPEQTTIANSNRCWNWFLPAHQAFSLGEPAMIVNMVNSVSQTFSIDSKRVYALGLSAGAAMSVILGSTYPNIFSAIGVGAGLEFKAATDTTSAFISMSLGGPNPVTQGQVAYKSMQPREREVGVIVFHGTSDFTVALVNGQQVITQYSTTLDLVIGKGNATGIISDKPTQTETGLVPGVGGRAYTINRYSRKDNGKVLLQYVTVNSMAHAWSGGNASGTYTDNKGPSASQMMIEFFANFKLD